MLTKLVGRARKMLYPMFLVWVVSLPKKLAGQNFLFSIVFTLIQSKNSE